MIKEFEKFAVKGCGITSTTLQDYRAYINPTILEERQLNVTQMDVFSRLMMERILFLEGFPEVSRIGEIRIGKNVEEILFKDYEGEVQAVKGYNETMNLAQRLGDNGTREMIAEILKDEEAHVDWLETQRELLSRMGLPAYLQYLAGEFSE